MRKFFFVGISPNNSHFKEASLPLVNRFDINGERNTITYRHRLTTKRLVEKIRDHHGYAPNFPAGLFKTHPNQTMLIKFLNNGKKPKPDRVPCNQRIMTQVPGLDGRLFTQNFANHVKNRKTCSLFIF